MTERGRGIAGRARNDGGGRMAIAQVEKFYHFVSNFIPKDKQRAIPFGIALCLKHCKAGCFQHGTVFALFIAHNNIV